MKKILSILAGASIIVSPLSSSVISCSDKENKKFTITDYINNFNKTLEINVDGWNRDMDILEYLNSNVSIYRIKRQIFTDSNTFPYVGKIELRVQNSNELNKYLIEFTSSENIFKSPIKKEIKFDVHTNVREYNNSFKQITKKIGYIECLSDNGRFDFVNIFKSNKDKINNAIGEKIYYNGISNFYDYLIFDDLQNKINNNWSPEFKVDFSNASENNILSLNLQFNLDVSKLTKDGVDEINETNYLLVVQWVLSSQLPISVSNISNYFTVKYNNVDSTIDVEIKKSEHLKISCGDKFTISQKKSYI